MLQPPGSRPRFIQILTISPTDNEGRRSFMGSRAKTNTVVTVAALALALRLVTLIATGHLSGSWEYDDAVYFGTALRLVHGVLPYRDFALIQPPGVPLLLAPVALLSYPFGSHHALEVARVLVVGVSFVNVLLVGRLLRHRSLLAIAVACLIMALYPDAILASSALLLEPFLNLFCLLGLVFVFNGETFTGIGWRLAAAGVAFGIGGTMKTWAILPAGILFLMLLWPQPSRALRFAIGAAVGVILPCLPFLILAPGQFVHQVAVDQIGRTGQAGLPIVDRLEFMTSVWAGLGVPKGHLYALLAVGATMVLAVIVLGAFLARSRLIPPSLNGLGGDSRLRITNLEWFAVISTLVVAGALLWPPDFFYHYPAFLAPFLGLLLAVSVERLAGLSPGPLIAVTAAVCLLGLAHAAAIPVLLQRAPDPAATIASVIPRGACVVTDDSEFTVNANRFVANSRSCPVMVDALGTTIAISGSQDPSSPAAQAAAGAWMSMFRRANYLLLTPLSYLRIPWNAELVSYVKSHFEPVLENPVLVLRRSRPGMPEIPFVLPTRPSPT